MSASIAARLDDLWRLGISVSGSPDLPQLGLLETHFRVAIGELLQRPAHLKLHVKVHPDWTTSPEALARYGYRS